MLIPIVVGMKIVLVVRSMTEVAFSFGTAFMLKTMLLEGVIVLEVTGLMTKMVFMFKGMRRGVMVGERVSMIPCQGSGTEQGAGLSNKREKLC